MVRVLRWQVGGRSAVRGSGIPTTVLRLGPAVAIRTWSLTGSLAAALSMLLPAGLPFRLPGGGVPFPNAMGLARP